MFFFCLILYGCLSEESEMVIPNRSQHLQFNDEYQAVFWLFIIILLILQIHLK